MTTTQGRTSDRASDTIRLPTEEEKRATLERMAKTADEHWREHSQRPAPKRYQVWRGRGSKAAFLVSFDERHQFDPDLAPNQELRVIDCHGTTRRRQKGKEATAAREVPGQVVARRKRSRSDPDLHWRFYGEWKGADADKAESAPLSVEHARAQLKRVGEALRAVNRRKDGKISASFLASEAGLREPQLARLLEASKEGSITTRGRTFPIPKVGVVLVYDKGERAWRVERLDETP